MFYFLSNRNNKQQKEKCFSLGYINDIEVKFKFMIIKFPSSVTSWEQALNYLL